MLLDSSKSLHPIARTGDQRPVSRLRRDQAVAGEGEKDGEDFASGGALADGEFAAHGVAEVFGDIEVEAEAAGFGLEHQELPQGFEGVGKGRVLGQELEFELIACGGDLDGDIFARGEATGEAFHQAREDLGEHGGVTDDGGELFGEDDIEGDVTALGLVLPLGGVLLDDLLQGDGDQLAEVAIAHLGL